MTTIKGYMGVALILLGALLLIVSYIAGWASSNLVLLSGLILIVLGAFMHIKHLKNGEKY
jgi:membrane-bound ClpP family serine protease